MNSKTGDLYEDKTDALKSGVPAEDIVELTGTPEAIERVSKAVKKYGFDAAKRKRKAQRESRRRNRK